MSPEEVIEALEPVYRYEDLPLSYRRFIDEYLVDCCPGKAATRAGFKGGPAADWLVKKPEVNAVLQQRLADRAHRLQITADDVLKALWEQYQRLLQMLTADWKDLYDDDGGFKAVSEWPELWRTAMVSGIDVEKMFERSKDGGQASWDESGVVIKIKRESRLAIEKQIKETLHLIGLHTTVKSFETTTIDNSINIVEVRLMEARRIAAQPAILKQVNGENSERD